MLPGQDGISVCRDLRQFYHAPIIMLTARDDEMDEVIGLEVGASDYMMKPVRPRALLARIKAALRSQSDTHDSATKSELINVGKLSIDSYRHAPFTLMMKKFIYQVPSIYYCII